MLAAACMNDPRSGDGFGREPCPLAAAGRDGVPRLHTLPLKMSLLLKRTLWEKNHHRHSPRSASSTPPHETYEPSQIVGRARATNASSGPNTVFHAKGVSRRCQRNVVFCTLYFKA